MMIKSRRSFLKVAGIAAIGMGAAPVMNLAASEPHGSAGPKLAKNEETLHAERWGMVIDTSKLNEDVAEAVKEACHKAHNVPDFTMEPDAENSPIPARSEKARKSNGFGMNISIMHSLTRKMNFWLKNSTIFPFL